MRARDIQDRASSWQAILASGSFSLAARLSSQAGRMEVIVDDPTRRATGEAERFEPLPELRLKGFSEAILAHRVVGTG